MPELPEVETVRAGLERHVIGRTVATAAVLNPRAVRRDLTGPEGFAAAMVGRTLLRAERRGKYLWIRLSYPPGGRPPVPPDVRADGPDRKNRDLIRPVGTDENLRETGENLRETGENLREWGASLPYGPGGEHPGEALLAHLGMSGQLLVGAAERPLSSHVRARFTFTDDGPDLRFTDQRTFGHLMLCSLRGDDPPAPPGMAGASPPHTPPRGDAQNPRAPRAVVPVQARRIVPAPIAHIAPDPLEAAFNPGLFAARLIRKRTEVKRALLDQSLISGVGNIYADEALWRARLHWARPTQRLRRPEIARLLEAVNEVLTEALKAGGTSFDALYVNVNGESGYFDRSLNAYGREDEPCGRCGTAIRRDAFMNRSSYSCPRCQPRPRSLRNPV